MNKRLLGILLVFILMLTQMTFAFNDTQGHWAKDVIEQAVQEGIVKGVTADNFMPDKKITRAEFTQIFMNFKKGKNTNKSTVFNDVSSDKWYYDAVMWAYDNKYVTGHDGGFFPDDNITRQDGAVILGRANQTSSTNLPALEKFADYDIIADYSKGYVAYYVEKGFFKGYEDNTLKPKKELTRAEALSLIMRSRQAEEPPTSSELSRGKRLVDIIMWDDIDIGKNTNDRPDNGWSNLNPEYPNDPETDGIFRTTTPILGLYDSQDPLLQKQHFYWMRALGANVVAADLTNWRSVREDTIKDQPWMEKFWGGIYKALEVQLKTSAEITEFEAPKIYPVARLNGSEFENLSLMLDDLYVLYGKYPTTWYKLNDGTSQANKPFLTIFADWGLLNSWAIKEQIPFEDLRFNIRWSNGTFETMKSAAFLNDKGYKVIPKENPYWLFVENEPDPNREGYYRTFYKEGAKGNVEQMITWASLFTKKGVWDGLHNKVDGKLPIERITEKVHELMPQTLLLNRWNYPIAWLGAAQEGVSREGSTHIEPNVDWGFDVFNSVTKEMYKLNKWSTNPPPKPEIIKIQNNIAQLDLKGFPLEYKLSKQSSLKDAVWAFIDLRIGGLKLPDDLKNGQTIYIQTRNTFGESSILSYIYKK